MIRYRLDIAYDGSGFSGWASQPGRRTVQDELETWLGRIAGLDQPLVVAGRTDAGVHARGQVAHADLSTPIDDAVLPRLRRALPADVVLTDLAPAPAGFDARFSATWRRYCYRLADGPLDPLYRHFVTAAGAPIDGGAMHAAAQELLGLRDFAAFCKRRDGASTVRTLQQVSVTRDGPLVEVWLRADAFCHSMVRSVVGALLAVGQGRRDIGWLRELVRAGERSSAVQVLAPGGLTLEQVGYPPAEQLAARAIEARAYRELPSEALR